MRKKSKILISAILAVGISLGVVPGVVLSSNPVVADGTVNYTENYTLNSKTGVKISVTPVESTATYEHWNYLNKEDLSKGFKYMFAPAKSGVCDMQAMMITFEDALDATQQVSVAWAQGDNWYGTKNTYGFAALTDQIQWNGNAYMTIKGSGEYLIGYQDWTGEQIGYSSMGAIPFGTWDTYDYFSTSDERSIVFDDWAVKSSGRLIADLENKDFLTESCDTLKNEENPLAERYTQSYIDNLFSSGKIKVKFTFFGCSSAVNFVITEWAGNSNTTKKDTSAPAVRVDQKVHAVVGVNYACPEPIIADNNDALNNLTVQTTVKDSSNNAVTMNGNSFTPTAAGNYTVTVTVKDKANLTSTYSYVVTAFAQFPAVTYTKTDSVVWKGEYCVSEELTVPQCVATSAYSALADQTLPTYYELKLDGNVLGSGVMNGQPISFLLAEDGVLTLNYYVIDAKGEKVYSDTQEAEVKHFPYIEDMEDEWVAIGATYVPEKQYAIYKGEYRTLQFEVVTQSGTVLEPNKKGEYAFAEEGTYFVKYSITVDGMTAEKTRTVNVTYLPSMNLNVTSGSASITSDAAYPNYAGTSETTVFVESNGGSTVRWNKVIDLSKLSADENIVKFLPIWNDECGGASYTITLTDVYNSRNKLSFYITPHGEIDSYCYIAMSYDGRRLARYTENGGEVHDFDGFGALATVATGRNTSTTAFYLRMDYEDSSFYTNALGDWQLLDLDDGSQVGYGREWGGFTTGEVTLEISISPQGDKAGYMLDEVAAQKLSGAKIDDKTAPILYFNEPVGFVNNNGVLPDALVGEEYPLLTARAYDAFTGEKTASYQILLNGTGDNLYEGGTSFCPQTDGTYTYIISAVDEFGNKVESRYTFTAKNTIPTISIAFENLDASTIKAGSYFTVPNVLVSGGSGKVEYTYSVYVGGVEVEVEDCGQLFVNASGKLKFVFEATDYLGTQIGEGKEFEYDIQVDSAPVMFVNRLPRVAIYNSVLKLPDFEAIDYNFAAGTDGYDAYRCVKVDGNTIFSARGGNMLGSLDYKVSKTTGTLRVEYCTGTNSANLTNTVMYKIPVYDAKSTKDFIIPYDYDDSCATASVSVNSTSQGVAYTVGGNKGLLIANPVSSTLLELKFSGIAGSANQQYVDVVLSDYNDSRNSVLLRIQKIDGSYFMNVNGNSSTWIGLTGSLEKVDEYIDIYYDNASKSILNDSGVTLATIERNLIGNTFKGFADGVLVSFDVHGASDVSKKGSINISKIGNQTFGGDTTLNDGAAPQISVAGAIASGTVQINKTVTLPKASAYDVLSGEAKVYVTVKFGSSVYNGIENVLADKDIQLTFTKYGWYNVTYTAEDGKGNTVTAKYTFQCKDVTPPTCTIDGDVPTSGKVGEAISLPNVTAEDNYSDASAYVMVVRPDGSTFVVSGRTLSFVAEYAGKYRVVYYVVDEDYNTQIVEHYVEVK